jgi:4-hydroxybenzoate polyprenyltransferase
MVQAIKRNKLRAGLGYFFVGLFCALCGYVLSVSYSASLLSTTNDANPLLRTPDKVVVSAALVYFIGLLVYIITREFTVEKDTQVETFKSSAEQLTFDVNTLGIFAIAVVTVAWMILIFTWGDNSDVWNVLSYLVSSLIPMIFLMLRARRAYVSSDSDMMEALHAFPNRIFFPAITACMSSFLVGWFANNNHESSWYFFISISLAYCLLIFFSGRKESSTRTAIFGFIVFLFALPILTRYFDGRGEFVAILLGAFISLSLGVTEVASRLPYICNPDSGYRIAKHENSEYYKSGANWSAFVFIPMMPLLALFLPSLPVWLMYFYTAFFLVVWIRVGDKSSPKFRKPALAFGFTLPLLIVIGLSLGKVYPEAVLLFGSAVEGKTASSLSDRITTILGVLLTIIFVILQSHYKTLMESRSKTNSFIDTKNCMLLYFVIASFLSIYSLFVMSILNKFFDNQIIAEAKVDEFQILSLVMIVLVLVFFVWDGGGENNGGGSHQSGVTPHQPVTDVAPVKAKLDHKRKSSDLSTRKVLGVAIGLVRLSRAFSSTLVATVTFALLVSLSPTSITTALWGAVSMLFATMFGFSINDTYDLYKDQRGQRLDKMLVSKRLSIAHAKYFSAACLILTLACSYFFLNFQSTIFLTVLCLALTVYSPFSKQFPLAKGLYTAALCLAPALLANTVALTSLVSYYILIPAMIFFVGREILIDAEDIESDILSKTNTLSVRMGRSVSIVLGSGIMAIAIFFVVFLSGNSVQGFPLFCAIFTLFAGCLTLRLNGSSSFLTRLPMALGVASVIF